MEETNEVAAEATEKTTAEVATYTGTVIWFNYKTGFGYIKPDDKTINDGKDLFIHYKGISDNLAVTKEGKPPFKKLLRDQRVKFELGKNSKGVVAINVDKEDTLIPSDESCPPPPIDPEAHGEGQDAASPEEVSEDTPVEVEEEANEALVAPDEEVSGEKPEIEDVLDETSEAES